jgi:iron complex transport system substrate-binding protein
MPPDHTARRIACLQPSATVILDAIGELARVIACTRYCADVVPGVANGSRTILADSWTADSAQITAVQPDLVIAAVPFQEKALAEILKSGARFLGLAPRTLANIYTDTATIAGTVGASDRGEEVIQAMQRRIEEVRARVAAAKRPKVFCEEWGKPVIASQPWVAELIEAAGGEFAGAPARQCSTDEIATLNPDVIIAAWCGAGESRSAGKSSTIVVDQPQRAFRPRVLHSRRARMLPHPRCRGASIRCAGNHPETFCGTKGIRRYRVPTASAENGC